MFSVSVTTILRTLLLATPVFSANATDWSSRSIYQASRRRIRSCLRLMEQRSLSQTGSLPPMTQRCLAMRVNASIAVARGRELRITSTIYKAWDSTPYGFRPFLPISRVRLLKAKLFTGAYCVHRGINVLVHDHPIRYWTKDFDTLNPHFGTADDLQALSDALHKRGMYLMLDVVVNHMAPLDPKVNFTGFYPPFADASSFHKRCFVAESTDLSNQTAVEQCWLGDANLPLPDLNTENSTVSGKLFDWIQNLVQNYSIDGLRIDTVKHIRKDFWMDFSKAAGVFTLGEVLINDTDYASQYTGR